MSCCKPIPPSQHRSHKNLSKELCRNIDHVQTVSLQQRNSISGERSAPGVSLTFVSTASSPGTRGSVEGGWVPVTIFELNCASQHTTVNSKCYSLNYFLRGKVWKVCVCVCGGLGRGALVLSSHKLMLMTAACVLGISCRSVLSSQENMAHTRTLYYLVSHQTTVLPCMESIDVGEIIGR